MYWMIIILFVTGAVHAINYALGVYLDKGDIHDLLIALGFFILADTTYLRYTLNNVILMEVEPDDS